MRYQYSFNVILAIVVVLLFAVSSLSFAQNVPEIQLTDTVALRDLFNRPYDHNVLKLFDAAIDQNLNEIYVTGIMTPHLAVVDCETDEVVRTKDIGITDFQLKYLFSDSATRSLYVFNSSEGELFRFDMDDDSSPSMIPVDSALYLVVDPERNLLYRTILEPPYFLIHDPISLEQLEIDCPACSSLEEGIGPMILDEDADRLYILDLIHGGTEGRIYVVNLTDLTLENTISIVLPANQRPKKFGLCANGNIYVATGLSLFSFTSEGTEIARRNFSMDLELEDFACDSAKGETFVLFRERPSDGLVEGIGNHVYKFVGSELSDGGSVSFGRKAHRMKLNSVEEKIYIPNADASVLWVISTETLEADSVRIGDSLEQITSGPSGSPLFMNSRLGGNYLIAYDPDTGEAEEFTAGTWPIPIQISSDGGRLIVNNAWDGTISIFDTSAERTLLGTIALDVPPGSTDRIPEMTVDDDNAIVFVAYPEHNQIAMADLDAYTSAGTVDITFLCNEDSESAGPAEVRLCAVEEHDRLFAFSYDKKLLAVYESSGSLLTLIDTISFDDPEMKWQRMNDAAARNWFYYDAIEDQLFLGPYILNAETGEWTGDVLPDIQYIFNRDDERGLYWGTGLETQGGITYNMLYLVGIEDHLTLYSKQLREASVAKPAFHIGVIRECLYVGYLMSGEFDIFDILHIDEGDGTEPVAGWVDVDLPSVGTGFSDGELAVSVRFPENSRYLDGAPILIFVPGGTTPGNSLDSSLSRYADDIILVTFLFPGGFSVKAGRESDGSYDDRGERCILALCDVILFAAGETADSSGWTIDDLSPVPVLHDNVGLLGSSNGGNIVIAAPALHGADFADNLKYIIQWESPVCSQFATTNLGGVQILCGGLDEYWRVVNPRYQAYGSLEVEIDYSQLEFNLAGSYQIFLDGDGDGVYTTNIVGATPWITPDVDGDGVLTDSEDFPLSAYEDGIKDVYSRQATQAFLDYDIFELSDPTNSWPNFIATPAEADAYWDIREAVRMYGDAFSNVPLLEGMVLGSVVDHVQTAPDFPHIHQMFDGWNHHGKWIQINPSPAYMQEVSPLMVLRTDLPDNTANMEPVDWTDSSAYLMAEDISDDIYQMAAILQMADRAHDASTSALLNWMAY